MRIPSRSIPQLGGVADTLGIPQNEKTFIGKRDILECCQEKDERHKSKELRHTSRGRRKQPGKQISRDKDSAFILHEYKKSLCRELGAGTYFSVSNMNILE